MQGLFTTLYEPFTGYSSKLRGLWLSSAQAWPLLPIRDDQIGDAEHPDLPPILPNVRDHRFVAPGFPRALGSLYDLDSRSRDASSTEGVYLA
jgi:hypothetical protein